MIKILSICSLGILVAFTSLRADTATSGAERVIPGQTNVLLLSPIDGTVDSSRLAPLRQQVVRLRQQYEFISRHFVVLGETMAAKAAASKPTLHLESEESRSFEALEELGKRAGADWVVSVVVKEIASDQSDSLDGAKVSVHSLLLVQIRDVRQHAWRVNHTYVGRLTGGGSPPEMFIESLDVATEEALAPVLAVYPQVVKVSQDGSIVDYLDDQTTPFVGDPEVPFLGLKAAKVEKP